MVLINNFRLSRISLFHLCLTGVTRKEKISLEERGEVTRGVTNYKLQTKVRLVIETHLKRVGKSIWVR